MNTETNQNHAQTGARTDVSAVWFVTQICVLWMLTGKITGKKNEALAGSSGEY